MRFKLLITISISCLLFVATTHRALAEDPPPPPQVLIKNVNVWDGMSDGLNNGVDVLITGNLIEKVGSGVTGREDATVIDGGGGTLMPGMIDMHSHFCFVEGVEEANTQWDQMGIGAQTAHVLVDYLDQGFTTARDAGCNILSIVKAVNKGRIPGPRIYSSGGFLCQTGGHCDWGRFNENLTRAPSEMELNGVGHIVNGRAEVMRAARHNLRGGATQIKIMAGGGVGSQWDPLHTTQFSLDEMKAAVEVAEDYGTYVLIHAYHDRSINRAIDAGIRVVEHGFLMSEETMQRMATEGIALSLQAVVALESFANPEEITIFTPDQQAKGRKVNTGAKNMIELARKHKVLIVTGGDMFGSAFVHRQADNLTIMTDVGFSPVEILRTATSSSAEVLSWSGEMSPYKAAYPDLEPEARAEKGNGLGVIEEGAYADVIIVDGNPLEDINMIDRDHVRVVIKDGHVYKNTLN